MNREFKVQGSKFKVVRGKNQVKIAFKYSDLIFGFAIFICVAF
jgi:hypothetical protein